MRSHQLTIGRTFAVALDGGDDFFEALNAFCRSTGVRQGYLPMFVAGFREAEIVGTCEKLADPEAPVWSSVHLGNVEALGCGTIVYDEERERILPPVHATLGWALSRWLVKPAAEWAFRPLLTFEVLTFEAQG